MGAVPQFRRWAAWLALVACLAARAAASPATAPAPDPGQAAQAWLRQHPVLTVGTVADGWPPYEARPGERLQGLSPDYLRAIATHLGVSLRPQVYADWPHLLAAACKGEVDVVMSVSITASRTRCLSYTRPYHSVRPAVVGRREDAARLLAPAPNLRIAIEAGYVLGESLPEAYPDARVLTVPDLQAALEAVADGRADAYIGNPHVVALALQRMPHPALAVLGPARLPPVTLHFATPNDRGPLAMAIDQALQTVSPAERAAIDRRWLDTRLAWASEPPLLSTRERQWLSTLPVLRVAYDPDWVPLTVRGSDGAMSGILGDYLQQMQSRLGLRLQAVPARNWREARALIAAGKADIAPASDDAGYGPAWRLTRPLVSFPCVIVTRRHSDTVGGLDDLAGKRIAVSDPDVASRLARSLPGMIPVEVASDREGLRQVVTRAADAYVGNLAAVDNQLRDHDFGDLHVAAPAGFSDHMGLAVRAPYAPLVPLLDRVAADMGEAARQDIRKRWLKVDYDYGVARPVVLWSSALALLIIGLLVAAYLRLRAEIARRREADDRLREISRNLPAVVFKLRRSREGDYRFVYVTGNPRPLFGLDAEQIMADAGTVFGRIRAEDQVVLHEAFESSARSLRPVACDFRATGAEGARWISLTAVPRRVDADAVHWSGYWDDSTDLHAQNEALERARATAVDAAAAKAHFLAVMSHEIRTPMAGLAGLLELLGRTPLSPAQRQLLATSAESAAALRQILDDVLDFSKAEAGQMQLEAIEVDLRGIASSVMEVSAPQARGKGLALDLSISNLLAARHLGDPYRLRQILLNLIGNAVKFTARGRVSLSIEVEDALPPREDAQQRVRIEVRDTGVGIDPTQQARLFRPFVQADATTTRYHGGTGLGLSISRQLAALMGGTLQLESTPGIGTRLTLALTLPVRRASLRDSDLAGHRVRVDIREVALREAVSGLLRGWGLVPADTAAACDAWIGDTPPPPELAARSIVLRPHDQDLGPLLQLESDPLLPSHLHRALLAILRPPPAEATPRPAPRHDIAPLLVVEDHPTNQMLIGLQLEELGYPHVIVGDGHAALARLALQAPSLVLTDISMPGMDGHALAREIRARQAGDMRVPILAMTANVLEDTPSADLDAYLHKPVDLAQLAAALSRWLPAATPATPGPPVDRAGALRARHGEHLPLLLDTFLETTTQDRHAVQDALARDDRPATAQRIHRISGALGYFGYTELAVAGRDLSHALESTSLADQREACEQFLQQLDAVCEELASLRHPDA
ncbi:transporter substrate-binding domain-containing protein [Stenotrophomonas sp. HITSZ_GD]|uniref:ATP-binding protein n=1 Tax=Stenotrophomonas sp. HITSZ_GD TaxID=3037248 RepID=UPI00240D961A|nr:transporter substrate-binding domain-containing protein [Stenotrophomonas sp. HITSZ_GD]MDG2526931.1 transporter substrate-binding domain-containing protein [Stenotrophomonas sp. HITSZ_GD]